MSRVVDPATFVFKGGWSKLPQIDWILQKIVQGLVMLINWKGRESPVKKKNKLPHRIHVWYIYLHLQIKFNHSCIGKYPIHLSIWETNSCDLCPVGRGACGLSTTTSCKRHSGPPCFVAIFFVEKKNIPWARNVLKEVNTIGSWFVPYIFGKNQSQVVLRQI